jgi:formiminoglutamase
MGGGHELAFGHYLGLASHLEKNFPGKKRIGIINFDAHFDLRPFAGESTSGTPFSQISDFCAEKEIDFSYLVLGIQKIANTKWLFQRAKDLGVHVIERDEMIMENRVVLSKKIADFWRHQDQVYVTICLDAFSAHVAPGVSAPSVEGIPLDSFFTLLSEILKSGKVSCLDVAELSPPFDPDGRTAKFAAKIIFEMVQGL